MKRKIKLYLIGLILFSSFFADAQTWIYFTGTVTNSETYEAVPDYPVFIYTNDSLFLGVVQTNLQGVYYDSIFITPSQTEFVAVEVFDCESEIHSNYFYQFDTINIADFEICVSQPDCYAYFEFEVGDDYLVQFHNYSVGNSAQWEWDFGDGNYSSEFEPEHQFNAPGEYQVCLFLNDSINMCFDTYCVYLFLGGSECTAEFSWEVNNDNPMLLEFTDQSIGEINSWYWDFGDNATSELQNPTHEYQLPGLYEVTLFISDDDSLGFCFDSQTEWIFVGDSVECISNFNVQLDSLNPVNNTFVFKDLSEGNPDEWYWDFGDGTYSFESNPVHVYDSTGTYSVCLTISSISGGFQCMDVSCQTITTAEYFNFGGQVFLGDYPLNIEENDSSNMAIANLYQLYGQQWHWVDSRNFWKYGYYWFTDKLAADYLIKAELVGGSDAIENYAPTYYGNSIYWTYAENFFNNSNEAFEININLWALTNMDAGVGSISGMVEAGFDCDGNAPTESGLLYLFDENENLVDYTPSSLTGSFNFEGLPNGIYTVKVEYTGMLGEKATVELTDSNPNWSNLSLSYNCQSFVGVGETTVSEVAFFKNLYPQPASERVTIELYVNSSSVIELEVLSMNGNLLLHENVAVDKSSGRLTLDVQHLPSGVYILKGYGKNGNGMFHEKILVHH